MPTYRLPVLIAEDFDGKVTAALVDRDVTAVAETRTDALLQIKEFLAWQRKTEGEIDAPDFEDPSLIYFKVDVRAEYRVERRIFPVEDEVTLRMACVRGRQAGGLRVASLPLLGFRFYYYEERALKDLVRHYVGEGLKIATPQALTRLFLPKSVELDELVVHMNARPKPSRVVGRLPSLEAVADPIGRRAGRAFGRAWEREHELAELVGKLRDDRANVILLGESGIGKSTLLGEAVRQIERGLKQDSGEDFVHRYWRTSGGRLISGMKYLGQWQERCERLVEELDEIGGVMCLENLRDLLAVGDRDPRAGVAGFLMPYLQRGELRMVVEATPEEIDACRRLLPGFADLFQVVRLEPFFREQALTILTRLTAALERDEGVSIGEGVATLVYRLFTRFVPYQAFPGGSVRFLRDVCERASVESTKVVDSDRVIRDFIRQTGLPEVFLRDELPIHFDDVVAAFSKEVIGQDAASAAAARVVTKFKSGMNDPGRPLAVLFFCGPTGVGKTQLVRTLARYFFGHGERVDRLVRLDMSEYAAPGSAARLVEKPDGTPSDFITRIRREPLSIVLLDEIEKAAPDVFDVLLSVFDEGRLADPYGRSTNFRSTIIVMTSNLGTDTLRISGFSEEKSTSYDAEAAGYFRPEFYNRLDEVVAFSSLDATIIDAITEKELGEIAAREGLVRSRLRLEWTPRLAKHVARDGFDPRYGARPLQRALETLVVAPLARLLIANPGLSDATIHVDVDDAGEVAFSVG